MSENLLPPVVDALVGEVLIHLAGVIIWEVGVVILISSSLFWPCSDLSLLNLKSNSLLPSGTSNAPGMFMENSLIESNFFLVVVAIDAGNGIPDVGVLGPTGAPDVGDCKFPDCFEIEPTLSSDG